MRSVSLERLQKDRLPYSSQWTAQSLKSHGAGKLDLYGEHFHAVRRRGVPMWRASRSSVYGEEAVVAGASPRAWFRLYVSRGDV